MTAPRYRINEEKGEWIIYVTDVGQSQHFDMLYKVWPSGLWMKHLDEIINLDG